MPAYLTNYVYALGQEMRPKSAAGTRALRPPPPVSAPTPVVQGLSRRSHLTAETRWTQRGKAATETADYGIRGRRETNRAVFCVFRGSYPQGNCSQPANNLDYCSAKSPKKIASFSSQADNQAITRRVSRNPRGMSHIPLSLCSLRSLRLTSTALFRWRQRFRIYWWVR